MSLRNSCRLVRDTEVNRKRVCVTTLCYGCELSRRTVKLQYVSTTNKFVFARQSCPKLKEWSQRFEPFCTASGIAEKFENVECATFLHVAVEEAIKTCNTFFFVDGEKDKIDVLKKVFQDYREPRKNLP